MLGLYWLLLNEPGPPTGRVEVGKPIHVLIVDDLEDDALMVAQELQRGGNDITSERVASPEAMRAAMKRRAPDLVLSDDSIPHFNAAIALAVLRESNPDVPFLIVSRMKKEANDVYRFSRLLEVGIIGIRTVDVDGVTVEANDAFLKMVGYTREDVAAGRIRMEVLYPPEGLVGQKSLLDQARKSGSFGPAEEEYLHRDGHRIPVLTGGALLEGDSPSFIQFSLDISEQLAREDELRRLWRAIEQSPASVVVTDATGAIEYVNPKFTRLTGYTASDVVGKNPRILQSGKQSPDFYKQMWETLTAGREWHGELCNRAKDGTLFWEATSISPVRNASGEVTHYIGVKEDVTERKAAERQLEHQALHDSLTGLPNRALFREQLIRAISWAKRNRTQVALFFLDLDRFKNVNDTLGHPVGDELLRGVASRLRGVIRESDTVARLGGDEFAILVPDLNRLEDAAAVARKVVAALAAPFHIGTQEIHTSGSLGITMFPTDAIELEGLFRNADLALYQAKRGGRNRLCFFSEEMDREVRSRIALEANLRFALERRELFLEYQPIISLEGERLVGVEALVRWRHPRDGVIAPGRFVPIAEESGLIVPLGEWILRTACRQLREWQDRGAKIRVSVNISSVQFRHEDFAATVSHVLVETGVDPAGLELELTESILMHDIQTGSRLMMRLHEMGLRLSIDDFGTGYSSLSYLRRLPAGTLKIDPSFVQAIESKHKDAAIVKAIIHLGHDIGLNVLAEGVETPAQRDYLREHRCDEVQGFLYSRPVAAAEIDLLMRSCEHTGRGQFVAPQQQ
ncbi:MAG: hypothetical protein C0467_22255 [Planctomycetaceae bacterium]|nr:hypothetical protein [Planctomycetaceae bacterium]